MRVGSEVGFGSLGRFGVINYTWGFFLSLEGEFTFSAADECFFSCHTNQCA